MSRQKRKKRDSTVEVTRQEWHITAQLLTISVKFILCYTPPIVYNLIEYIFTDWAMNSDASVYVVDIINALVVFHRLETPRKASTNQTFAKLQCHKLASGAMAAHT